jgi:hypothetical protein
MKTSYFYSTWAASCVASTGGGLYAALVAVLISRGRIGLMEIVTVVLVSIILSLPVLIAGSAVIGWWLTKFLSRRVRTNRILVFSMAGMSMGLIADLVLLVLGFIFLGFSLHDVPLDMDGLINAALAASIPIFCLTLAGLVAGAHVTQSESGPGIS